MTPKERAKLEFLLRSLTGLELWLTGDTELPKTAEDDFMALRARLLIYEEMLWPSEGDHDGERKV